MEHIPKSQSGTNQVDIKESPPSPLDANVAAKTNKEQKGTEFELTTDQLPSQIVAYVNGKGEISVMAEIHEAPREPLSSQADTRIKLPEEQKTAEKNNVRSGASTESNVKQACSKVVTKPDTYYVSAVEEQKNGMPEATANISKDNWRNEKKRKKRVKHVRSETTTGSLPSPRTLHGQGNTATRKKRKTKRVRSEVTRFNKSWQDVVKDITIQTQVTIDPQATLEEKWEDVAHMEPHLHVQPEVIPRSSWQINGNSPAERHSETSTAESFLSESTVEPLSTQFDVYDWMSIQSETTTMADVPVESDVQTEAEKTVQPGEPSSDDNQVAVEDGLGDSVLNDAQEVLMDTNSVEQVDSEENTELLSPSADAQNEIDMKEWTSEATTEQLTYQTETDVLFEGEVTEKQTEAEDKESIQSEAFTVTRQVKNNVPGDSQEAVKQSTADKVDSETIMKPLSTSTFQLSPDNWQVEKDVPDDVERKTEKESSVEQADSEVTAEPLSLKSQDAMVAIGSKIITNMAETKEELLSDDLQVENSVPDDTQELVIDTEKQNSVKQATSEATTEPMLFDAQDELDMKEWITTSIRSETTMSYQTDHEEAPTPSDAHERDMKEWVSIPSETTMAKLSSDSQSHNFQVTPDHMQQVMQKQGTDDSERIDKMDTTKQTKSPTEEKSQGEMKTEEKKDIESVALTELPSFLPDHETHVQAESRQDEMDIKEQTSMKFETAITQLLSKTEPVVLGTVESEANTRNKKKKKKVKRVQSEATLEPLSLTPDISVPAKLVELDVMQEAVMDIKKQSSVEQAGHSETTIEPLSNPTNAHKMDMKEQVSIPTMADVLVKETEKEEMLSSDGQSHDWQVTPQEVMQKKSDADFETASKQHFPTPDEMSKTKQANVQSPTEEKSQGEMKTEEKKDIESVASTELPSFLPDHETHVQAESRQDEMDTKEQASMQFQTQTVQLPPQVLGTVESEASTGKKKVKRVQSEATPERLSLTPDTSVSTKLVEIDVPDDTREEPPTDAHEMDMKEQVYIPTMADVLIKETEEEEILSSDGQSRDWQMAPQEVMQKQSDADFETVSEQLFPTPDEMGKTKQANVQSPMEEKSQGEMKTEKKKDIESVASTELPSFLLDHETHVQAESQQDEMDMMEQTSMQFETQTAQLPSQIEADVLGRVESEASTGEKKKVKQVQSEATHEPLSLTPDTSVPTKLVEIDVPDDTQEAVIDIVKQSSVEQAGHSETITEPSTDAHKMDMKEQVCIPTMVDIPVKETEEEDILSSDGQRQMAPQEVMQKQSDADFETAPEQLFPTPDEMSKTPTEKSQGEMKTEEKKDIESVASTKLPSFLPDHETHVQAESWQDEMDTKEQASMESETTIAQPPSKIEEDVLGTVESEASTRKKKKKKKKVKQVQSEATPEPLSLTSDTSVLTKLVEIDVPDDTQEAVIDIEEQSSVEQAGHSETTTEPLSIPTDAHEMEMKEQVSIPKMADVPVKESEEEEILSSDVQSRDWQVIPQEVMQKQSDADFETASEQLFPTPDEMGKIKQTNVQSPTEEKSQGEMKTEKKKDIESVALMELPLFLPDHETHVQAESRQDEMDTKEQASMEFETQTAQLPSQIEADVLGTVKSEASTGKKKKKVNQVQSEATPEPLSLTPDISVPTKLVEIDVPDDTQEAVIDIEEQSSVEQAGHSEITTEPSTDAHKMDMKEQVCIPTMADIPVKETEEEEILSSDGQSLNWQMAPQEVMQKQSDADFETAPEQLFPTPDEMSKTNVQSPTEEKSQGEMKTEEKKDIESVALTELPSFLPDHETHVQAESRQDEMDTKEQTSMQFETTIAQPSSKIKADVLGTVESEASTRKKKKKKKKVKQVQSEATPEPLSLTPDTSVLRKLVEIDVPDDTQEAVIDIEEQSSVEQAGHSKTTTEPSTEAHKMDMKEQVCIPTMADISVKEAEEKEILSSNGQSLNWQMAPQEVIQKQSDADFETAPEQLFPTPDEMSKTNVQSPTEEKSQGEMKTEEKKDIESVALTELPSFLPDHETHVQAESRQDEMDTKEQASMQFETTIAQPPSKIEEDVLGTVESEASTRKKKKKKKNKQVQSEAMATPEPLSLTSDTSVPTKLVEIDVPDDTQEAVIDIVKQSSVEQAGHSETITEPLSIPTDAHEMEMKEQVSIPKMADVPVKETEEEEILSSDVQSHDWQVIPQEVMQKQSDADFETAPEQLFLTRDEMGKIKQTNVQSPTEEKSQGEMKTEEKDIESVASTELPSFLPDHETHVQAESRQDEMDTKEQASMQFETQTAQLPSQVLGTVESEASTGKKKVKRVQSEATPEPLSLTPDTSVSAKLVEIDVPDDTQEVVIKKQSSVEQAGHSETTMEPPTDAHEKEQAYIPTMADVPIKDTEEEEILSSDGQSRDWQMAPQEVMQKQSDADFETVSEQLFPTPDEMDTKEQTSMEFETTIAQLPSKIEADVLGTVESEASTRKKKKKKKKKVKQVQSEATPEPLSLTSDTSVPTKLVEIDVPDNTQEAVIDIVKQSSVEQAGHSETTTKPLSIPTDTHEMEMKEQVSIPTMADVPVKESEEEETLSSDVQSHDWQVIPQEVMQKQSNADFETAPEQLFPTPDAMGKTKQANVQSPTEEKSQGEMKTEEKKDIESVASTELPSFLPDHETHVQAESRQDEMDTKEQTSMELETTIAQLPSKIEEDALGTVDSETSTRKKEEEEEEEG